jgi:hypothetical protein
MGLYIGGSEVRLMMFYCWKIKDKDDTDLNVNPTYFKGSIKDAKDRLIHFSPIVIEK